MKKVSALLAIPMLVIGLVAVVPNVSAQTSDETAECLRANVRNTGPDSENKIFCDDEEKFVLECNTNINVENNNEQNAESGSAEVSKNTEAGQALSGAVSNNSEAEIKIIVDNICASVAKEEEPEKPVTPPAVVTAKETTPPAAPQSAPVVTSLPTTGTTTPIEKAGIVAAAAGLVAVVVMASTKLYQRFNA